MGSHQIEYRHSTPGTNVADPSDHEGHFGLADDLETAAPVETTHTENGIPTFLARLDETRREAFSEVQRRSADVGSDISALIRDRRQRFFEYWLRTLDDVHRWFNMGVDEARRERMLGLLLAELKRVRGVSHHVKLGSDGRAYVCVEPRSIDARRRVQRLYDARIDPRLVVLQFQPIAADSTLFESEDRTNFGLSRRNRLASR